MEFEEIEEILLQRESRNQRYQGDIGGRVSLETVELAQVRFLEKLLWSY